MAVWMVRGGRDGVFESLAIEQGLAIIGWSELPDLSQVRDQSELRALCEKAYPDAPPGRISNFIGRLWSFRERMRQGDLVVMPFKNQSAVAVGEMTGPYAYRPELPGRATHVRPIKWLRTDVQRNSLDQDILQSLNARGTLKAIRAEAAEERLRAIISGARGVSDEVKIGAGGKTETEDSRDAGNEEDALDIEQFARDQIMGFIGRKFRGHDFARLVEELLKAQGYHTQFSPPGPDGGVDIIAGSGPMGFDRPRLCVQVKCTAARVDVSVLRELQGVLRNFGAEQGLLVSWGGFKSSVTAEARKLFFQVRLWDAGDLVTALLQNYDQLSDEIQAELPLKHIWALVQEEE